MSTVVFQITSFQTMFVFLRLTVEHGDSVMDQWAGGVVWTRRGPAGVSVREGETTTTFVR